VYHATGERVRDLPITVEKIFLKGAMAGRRAVAVFRGRSLGIGSGIHPAIHGEIRAGNVRGFRAGDERHQRGDLINGHRERPAALGRSARRCCYASRLRATPYRGRRFAISSRTAGTSSTGTSIAVCVVAS